MNAANIGSADIKVSVVMPTYNHGAFIAQAIESVLMQKTDFVYEIVIGEDCSTDNTRAIVIDYAQRYPDRIRPLLHEKNMGGAPGMKNFLAAVRFCSGKYIALLEGDDYWTDLHKLQKQVDFLEQHPDYSICSHNVKLANDTELTDNEWLGRDHPVEYTIEDLLSKGSGGASCSLVFRKAAFIPFPDWYPTLSGGDWALQVLCAERGKMHYMQESMGVYRQHDKGWKYYVALNAKRDKKGTIALATRNGLFICDTFDKHFSGRYKKEINFQRSYWYWVGATEYVYVQRMKAWLYLFMALFLIPQKDWKDLPNFDRFITVILFGDLPSILKKYNNYMILWAKKAKRMFYKHIKNEINTEKKSE